MPATYDIIVPHYGASEELVTKALVCLRSIRAHSQGSDYRLIWVDNGSTHGISEINEELRLHEKVTAIRSRVNLGFVKATNAGLYMSTAPYVVLMNNDTEAVPRWLPTLRSVLRHNVGLSGPLTTTLSSWQGRYCESDQSTVILPARAMLAFFCVMIRREVIAQVGVLDEAFGMGLGDDDWYCHQAERAGWKMALVRSLRIPHHHRSTFHTMWTPVDVLKQQRKALALFYEKCNAK